MTCETFISSCQTRTRGILKAWGCPLLCPHRNKTVGVRKYPRGKRGCKEMPNPRWTNGAQRRKYRARFKAMNAPCGICKGRLGEIHYDEPSDHLHPLSFVIDEIKPCSRWKEWGYGSAKEACADWNNLQASHWVCNAHKSNRTMGEMVGESKPKVNLIDGAW